MNVFQSEKAPYVVVFLLTLLGWHISQLADDIRSARAVSYYLAGQGRTGPVRVTIHNVSKTKSLPGVKFSLACRTNERCLIEQPPFLKVHAPHLVSASNIDVDATAITIETTLAAGGRFEFGGELSGQGAPPRFFFVPDEAKPLDIYVFNARSLRGRVIENYFTLVLISFAALTLLLSVIMIRIWRTPAVAPPGAKEVDHAASP